MSSPRYLTKSRYKLGIECPTKLYYTGKKEYPDTKMDDSFMEALADGGYQVGELAKHYFPDGHDITTLDHEEAESQTNELLKQDNVVIYEPAIRFNSLFIRIDVLVKTGNHFDLIEVKAKSFDSNDESPFFGKRGGLLAKWAPYLHDVAFQNHVLSKAFPEASINNYLMLADKNAVCTTNGLNQKFRISRDENNRKGITVSNTLNDEDLSHKVLIQVPVDEAVNYIHEQKSSNGESFDSIVNDLSNSYVSDQKISATIGSKCKKCEFRCSVDDEATGLKNGFKECWAECLGWTDADFDEPTVLDISNYRSADKMIAAGKIKFSDLSKEDLNVKSDNKPGLTNSERQWLQVKMGFNNCDDIYIDSDGMKSEMDSWVFPLHFIDFETSTVALPLLKGRKPYEGIAFQFSHHVYHENGDIEHSSQYLNTEQGVFPNFEFVRALKKSLENDNGSIFCYADHENSYLNLIYQQIQELSDDIADADELSQFIKSITHSTGSSSEKWAGDRDMIDMLKVVKRYYYNPATNGSNSIKDVLPAILNSSKYLQEKYSNPVYGSKNGIKSLNLTDWTWVEMNEEEVVDPYKKLPKLFADVSDKNINLLFNEDELASGGAALTAYAKLQFEDISDYERQELEKGLLKYCELDTFAMVMIYEAWVDMLN